VRKNAQDWSILMKKILHAVVTKPALCNDSNKITNQENQRNYIFVIIGTLFADNETLTNKVQYIKNTLYLKFVEKSITEVFIKN